MTISEVRTMIAEAIEGTDLAGRTYIVGGAVRDQLLGSKDYTWDFDICVEMRAGGRKLGKRLRGHTLWDSNKENRVYDFVRLNYGEFCLEITGTRVEKYASGSRFPKISYGDLLADMYRRDFTINALVMEVFSGDIIDLTGYGIPDLEAKIIRTVKDPVEEFTEDPLRILRAVRFAARLGFEILPEVRQAIVQCAPLVLSLKAPTQQRELVKVLEDPSAGKVNQLYTELDLYQYIHPSKLIKKLKKRDFT